MQSILVMQCFVCKEGGHAWHAGGSWHGPERVEVVVVRALDGGTGLRRGAHDRRLLVVGDLDGRSARSCVAVHVHDVVRNDRRADAKNVAGAVKVVIDCVPSVRNHLCLVVDAHYKTKMRKEEKRHVYFLY